MQKNSRPLIVIDTNVFISAALTPKGTSAEVIGKAYNKYDLAFTQQTYTELAEKLKGLQIKLGITSELVEKNLEKFRTESKFFPQNSSLNLCRDSKDDKFISLAEQENAKYLITGDKDLLSIKPELVSTKIITPRDFLEHEKHLSRAESYGLTSEKAEEFARRMQQFEARQPKTLVQELNKNRNQDIER